MNILIVPPPGMEKSGWRPIEFLGSALNGHGIHVVEEEETAGRCSAIVVFNDRPSIRLRRTLSRIPKRNRILVVMEPEATGPTNYSRRTLTRYAHTFFASPLWANRAGGEWFPWPHSIAHGRAVRMEPTSRQFDTTMIFANKRSSSPQSLYQLRRHVIRDAAAANVKLALFGPNWDYLMMHNALEGVRATIKGLCAGSNLSIAEAFSDLNFTPSQWLGPIKQKQVALRSAPTTIAIENSMDFVSEKLFDPILCGVVPVYVGPELEQFGIPRSVVLRAPAESQQILETVRNTSPAQLDEIRVAGSEWIRSDSALKFDVSRVMAELGRRISQKLL